MTILKIGFAMGGGIALGTFNGAALSETIKLAILRGIDRNKQPFEKVEVDVFSGASAGSMSLGLMLRTLVHQTDTQLLAAEKKLIEQFGDEFASIQDDKKEDLIAAQVVQDIQHKVWVDEISMKGLLSNKSTGQSFINLKTTAGILNRSIVDNIAKRYFDFDPERFPDGAVFGRRRILSDRVLFASALSNLTPIINDARAEYRSTLGGTAVLADGLTSQTHRELRVFDLSFNSVDEPLFDDEKRHPKRWVRYHAGKKIDNKVGSLGDASCKAWAKMAATSISSGAFPFAFEPVVLERYRYEYGDQLWPKELSGKEKAYFTYTDGGTYNNEPIREAFRMASFIDAHNTDVDSERWIVFVDPWVSELSTSFYVPVHQQYALEDPNMLGNVDGYDLVGRTSIDRLLPHTFSIISALSNQSRALEGDKIYQVRKQFETRNKLRPLIKATLTRQPTIAELEKLHKNIEETLDKDRTNMQIPPGTLTPEGELNRIISAVYYLKVLSGKIDDYLSAINSKTDELPNKELWLEALSYVVLDLTLNLIGKDEHAKFVAIGPISNPDMEGKELPDKIKLPGARLGAFGGFMARVARNKDTEIGNWCAQKFLETAELIVQHPMKSPPNLSDDEKKEYQDKLKTGTDRLVSRLISMIADGNIPFFSSIPKPLLSFFLKSKILKGMNDVNPSTTYEIRVKVPTKNHKDFEFDGPGKLIGDQDIKTVFVDDGYYLISFANYNSTNKTWSGPHIKERLQRLVIDHDKFFDSDFCEIELPQKPHLEEANLLGYPVFQLEIKNSDKDKKISARRWKVKTLARPLFQEFVRKS